MRLLMITRKVDRSEHLAGFIYNWVKKIGENVDELRVISWQEGDSSGLPGNIKVYQLPTGGNKLIKICKFERLLWQNISRVDGVFCHQMPLYTILAAPLAKIHGKKIVSWYMHRQVDLKLRVMEKLADVILSASKESFRLPSKKLKITGHGIDVGIFKPGARSVDETFRLITVGRISPRKDYESMIKAVAICQDNGIYNIKLSIIGEPGLAGQRIYFENLQRMAEGLKLDDKVEFLGSRPNSEIPGWLQKSDLFINTSGTGSIDKAVLEAMACGCLVLTANEAFAAILPEQFRCERDRPDLLAEKIAAIIKLPAADKEKYREAFIAEVREHHNLDNLVKLIVNQF